MNRIRTSLWLGCAVVAGLCVRAPGGDWPTWRYDTKRSAASPHALPGTLHLQWVREYPPLKVAWPDEPRLMFDAGYEPVVMGKTMFIGSSRNDSVTALDTDTGEARWRFYAAGPIRFAPVAWRDGVYVASDDGHLYCLDAATGERRWTFRGAPSDRLVLGNERLISAWPARGGPVIADGTVYFGASIWPFMGTFLYALDAETGAEVWVNDGLGSMYIQQPHRSPGFAGPAPQGYLAVAGDRLLVPSGRSVPACFDRRTGELEYYHLSANGKRGGYHVSVAGDMFVNHDWAYELRTGNVLGMIPIEPVLTDGVVYTSSAGHIRGLDPTRRKIISQSERAPIWSLPSLWDQSFGEAMKVFVKAGPRLYAGEAGTVIAVDVPKPGGGPKVSWRGKISGTPSSMLAADDKLFVVTRQGHIYCFGGQATTPKRHALDVAAPAASDHWDETASAIIEQSGVAEGYALAFGVGTGRLIEALARRTNLHVIGLDLDAKRIDALRRRFDAAGLYGSRIALLVGDAVSVHLPPYLASLVVSEDLEAGGFVASEAFVKGVFDALRPYGGTAYLPVPAEKQETLASLVKQAGLAKARLTLKGEFAVLTREGALPGAADWTHQYADASNTCVSMDERVKTPLGLLWFGGPSNVKILPRHGHGPSEQVVDGRLFIEGPNVLRALDVYTGRLLWEADLPGIGQIYDNSAHQPGANAIGSNYVSVIDGVYVAHGRTCLRLDPATGKTLSTFTLPPWPDRDTPPTWGHVRVDGDLLIAGALPVDFGLKDPLNLKRSGNWSWDATASKRLDVMDRHSGERLWSATAAHSFRHNAICVGGGKVFCIDKYPDPVVSAMRRRGRKLSGNPAIVAFDARTGTQAWRITRDVFGTWLAYSAKHDILLQAGRASRDMLSDEPANRMIAYRGKDGSVVWDKSLVYQGPCMLHGETIITQGSALSLLTGEPMMRANPLTGGAIPWAFTRTYGCGTAIGSRHLLTFRSAAAGFFDLASLGGTGNLGGFRSSCTSNLIVADGVLNAPDYTRDCTCSYQNQCSVAFVHVPEIETWSFNDIKVAGEPVTRVGVNFGAPGDRMAEDGVLWLEYPKVGGPSPLVPTAHEPAEPTWFRRHSLRVDGAYSWVAASGAKGLTSVTLTLAKASAPSRRYAVRLVFCEPDKVEPGQRVFDVMLQGRRVLSGFDVVKEAGGRLRSVVKAFRDVAVKDTLRISTAPVGSATIRQSILCGVEAVVQE